MNATAFIIIGVFAAIALAVWFLRFRKPSSAGTVSKLPNNTATLKDEWFEERLPDKVIWKLLDRDTQPGANVECVAYSTQEQMESPPFNAASVPTIPILFKDIADNSHADNSQGLPPTGGMDYLKRNNYIKEYFKFTDLEQMVEFLRNNGTFQAGMFVFTLPKFEGIFLTEMNGQFAFRHSVLVFGFDSAVICPDGSAGAFKVRWHIDFWGDGSIEGWIPFSLAEILLIKDWTFGYSF